MDGMQIPPYFTLTYVNWVIYNRNQTKLLSTLLVDKSFKGETNIFFHWSEGSFKIKEFFLNPMFFMCFKLISIKFL